jgi:hypothetical protein
MHSEMSRRKQFAIIRRGVIIQNWERGYNFTLVSINGEHKLEIYILAFYTGKETAKGTGNSFHSMADPLLATNKLVQ